MYKQNMIGEHLREAMRQWTSGVTVVTTTYRTMPHGMTVNSFSSISLDPPAIAVSMTTSTRTCKYVLASGYFGVHILSQNQQHLADLFSGRGVDESNRFSHVAHAFGIHEVPQLNESMALLQCRVMYTHPLKNSTIILGEVLDVQIHPEKHPLIYHQRMYHKLGG